MKMFKEFVVIANENELLAKAICMHLERLGYSGAPKGRFNEGYCYYACSDGYAGWDDAAENSVDDYQKITLDEFFSLTPEDVIIEPERFDVRVDLSVRNNSGHNNLVLYSKLEASQIDRIKDIMNEGES
jgi:hypothetical protein